jgi:hypothetical protein
MFFYLFPQPLVIAPARHKVPGSRQQPPEESHHKSSAFASQSRVMIAVIALLVSQRNDGTRPLGKQQVIVMRLTVCAAAPLSLAHVISSPL